MGFQKMLFHKEETILIKFSLRLCNPCVGSDLFLDDLSALTLPVGVFLWSENVNFSNSEHANHIYSGLIFTVPSSISFNFMKHVPVIFTNLNNKTRTIKELERLV